MPFIKPERRHEIDWRGLNALEEIQPGDRCYVHYKRMVDEWRAGPSWATAHNIFKDMVDVSSINASSEDTKDEIIASTLAWQVFFVLHVIPYELKKQEENGDI